MGSKVVKRPPHLTPAEKDLLERLTRAEHPPHSVSDNIEWTESEIRHRLKGLVEELAGVAAAAERDGRVSLDERLLYRRQGDILSAAATRLMAFLEHHPDQRFNLLQVLGSAILLAYEAAEHLDAPMRELKRTRPATKATTARGNLFKEAIDTVVRRRFRPAYPPKYREPFAEEITDEVNKEFKALCLENKLKVKKITAPAVEKQLRTHPNFVHRKTRKT
jgi:hypothetical protein